MDSNKFFDSFLIYGPDTTLEKWLLSITRYWHGRNFVVKCVGDNLAWNQYFTKPKEKNVGIWHVISSLSEKLGGAFLVSPT